VGRHQGDELLVRRMRKVGIPIRLTGKGHYEAVGESLGPVLHTDIGPPLEIPDRLFAGREAKAVWISRIVLSDVPFLNWNITTWRSTFSNCLPLLR
jgi:hypothetical protein